MPMDGKDIKRVLRGECNDLEEFLYSVFAAMPALKRNLIVQHMPVREPCSVASSTSYKKRSSGELAGSLGKLKTAGLVSRASAWTGLGRSPAQLWRGGAFLSRRGCCSRAVMNAQDCTGRSSPRSFKVGQSFPPAFFSEINCLCVAHRTEKATRLFDGTDGATLLRLTRRLWRSAPACLSVQARRG